MFWRTVIKTKVKVETPLTVLYRFEPFFRGKTLAFSSVVLSSQLYNKISGVQGVFRYIFNPQGRLREIKDVTLPYYQLLAATTVYL